jgi:hypothetical protein
MAQHRDARRSDRAYLRTCEKRCFWRQASAIFEADGDAGSEVNPSFLVWRTLFFYRRSQVRTMQARGRIVIRGR